MSISDDEIKRLAATALLDEVERLRAENAQLVQARDFHFNAANNYCDQLAKAVAALEEISQAALRPAYNQAEVIEAIACHTLKEIQG